MNHHHFKSCFECSFMSDLVCSHPESDFFSLENTQIIDHRCPMLKIPCIFTVEGGPKIGELPCPECGKFQVPRGKRLHPECAQIRIRRSVKKYQMRITDLKKKRIRIKVTPKTP